MPRPTKCTKEIIERLADCLRAGNSYTAACAAVGLSYNTFKHWKRKANDGLKPYAQFFTTLYQAETEAQMLLLQRITEASAKDWRAAAWILERRYSETWGTNAELLQKIQEIEQFIAEAERGNDNEEAYLPR